MRSLALVLSLSCVTRGAPEFAEPYLHRGLELKIGRPAGWDAVFENGVLVVHKDGVGFRVSRQPFLHDPKAFPAAWEAELAAAGLSAKVTTAKVGKHEAFRAAYELPEPKRALEIWRVRVADGEWLYNVTFSVPPGYDAKPLVEGALKPFDCTQPAPKLEWNGAPEQLGNFFQFRLPKGYAKDPSGKPGAWVAYQPGTEPPRERGRFAIEQYDPRGRYALPGGKEVSGGDTDGVALAEWHRLAGAFARSDKPRSGAGRGGPFKGTIASGAVFAQDGTAKLVYVFATKTRQIPVAWSLVVDARDVRMFPNLFKEILDTFKEP